MAGVDLGLHCFAAISDGVAEEVVLAPKPLGRGLRRLRRRSRAHSRKTRGSANRRRSALRLARLHRRIRNTRVDFLHKLSTTLAKTKSVVVLEDLNVRGMVRNGRLARHIADAGWGAFRRMLEYKSRWYGAKVVVAPRFLASSIRRLRSGGMLWCVHEIRIPVGDFSVTASRHGDRGTAVVLGHGAGGDRRTRMLVDLAEALVGSGRQAVLYNFPYSDHGRGAPDPPDVLERTARAVGEYARATLGAGRVVLGGKSMAGRIASQVVAAGAPAGGLVFLGYPLHPPGKTQVLRDRHLPAIEAPMLFVQGTRDAFARWELLEALIDRLGPRATLYRVEEGDHSFKVPKRAGRSPAEIQDAIFGAILRWLEAHGL